MLDATGLAQHILSREPAKDAARLCFYHYLKNLCEANEPVTPELLNSFFARALMSVHWQENKDQLFNEVNTCLKSFFDARPEEGEAATADLRRLWKAEDIQVVRIESQRNLMTIVNRAFEREKSTAGEQFRILPENDGRAVAIRLTQDKQIQVTVYPPVAKIVDGEISPLCSDFTLTYGPDLLLVPNALQQIDVGGHTTARFRFNEEGCRGLLIRGYTFQKYAAMEGGSLHRHPILFYPLKRLEQHFINRKTDPMYIELTGILEKATELLSQGHPEAVKFGMQALERGKLALEQIFPDDKLVRLLINNLEKTLALEATRQPRIQEEMGASAAKRTAAADSAWETTMAPNADWSPSASGQNSGRQSGPNPGQDGERTRWSSGASANSWVSDPRTGKATEHRLLVDLERELDPLADDIACEKIRPLNS